MIEHLSKTDLNRYSKRTLSPAELLVINDHLAFCEECYRHSNAEDRLRSTVAFVQSDLKSAEDEDLDHLTHDQVAAFVGNELDEFERNYAQFHLAICPACETIRKDVLQFRADLNFDKVYAPLGKSTFKERLRDLAKLPIYQIPIMATGLLVALAMLAWVAALPLRNNLTDLQTQIDQLRMENESLRNSASIIAKLEGDLEQLRKENLRLQELSQARQNSSENVQNVVTLNDGNGKVALDNQGGLAGLNFIASKDQDAVKRALRLQRAELPSWLKDLAGKPSVIMGNNPNPFPLLSPVDSVVSTNVPTFRWKPLDGAAGYHVIINSGNSRKPISSEMLTVTEWKPPPLVRGRIYSWQVRALNDGKEFVSPAINAPEAKFKILEKSQAEELERAKRLYAKSHLTLGLLYARLGFLDDAMVEFRALRDANPNSPLVGKLLESVTGKQPRPNPR